jgi:hypothetical protein
MADPISNVSGQSSSGYLEGEVEGGMCGGTDGGMSVLPELATSLPNRSSLENGFMGDYLLADGEVGTGLDAYWQGDAQAGHIGAYRAANDGTMGAPGFEEPVGFVPGRSGAGVVVSGEANVPGGAGLQVSGVYDRQCGFGFVVNMNVAVQASSDPSPSLRAGVAAYNGSFDDFNHGTETEIGAGVVAYQTRWDEDGNQVGDGLALGLGGGVSVSGSRSVTLFKAFSGCED